MCVVIDMFKKIFILMLTSLLFLSGCNKNSKELTDKNNNQSNNFESNEVIKENDEPKEIIKEIQKETKVIIIKETNTNEDNAVDTKTNTEIKETTVNDTKEISTTKQDENNALNIDTNTYSTKDSIVIDELKIVSSKTDTVLKESAKDKAKGIFITLVDFIFYDGEIKGVKFDELTLNGKKKALEIISNIDLKIENKFPNYKDEISAKAKNALNKASELIKKGSYNINEFAKEKLGTENYNSLIEAKDDLVKYSKNAISIIGNFSSNLYSSSKEKLKNWYENLKKN